jgi:GDP-fucose transporter C1
MLIVAVSVGVSVVRSSSTVLEYSYLLQSAYFWSMMLIAGVLGFLIGIVTVMQIQWTSPLTHNISGTAKACVQTILAYFIWQNDSTVKGNIGVALVILGSGIYAFVRMREMDAAAAAKGGQYQAVPTNAGPQSPKTGATTKEVELVQQKV